MLLVVVLQWKKDHLLLGAKLTKLSFLIPTLALVFSVGVLSFHLSPCNIASGQISCASESTTGFSSPLRIANSINDDAISVSATPTSNESGLFSLGEDSEPIWKDGFWSVTQKAGDTGRNTATFSADPHLASISILPYEIISVEAYLWFSSTEAAGNVDAEFYIVRTGAVDHLSQIRYGGDETGGTFEPDESFAGFRCHVDSANDVLCVLKTILDNPGASSESFDIWWAQGTLDAGETVTLKEESFILHRTIGLN